ncbi:MAG: glycosyl transferase family 36 [Bacteroidetes bacterium]|nr:glycosyl transferase family 36 [Bacteroidota bacterium]
MQFKTKYGGFSDDGNEYVISTWKTPKPWTNVLTNGDYGLVISQTGGGFSFLTHSEFNRLNRWHQDIVQDNWGKYLYIKNNRTGKIWSPTWQPVKQDPESYEVRFGFGYAVFTSEFAGIRAELTILIPIGHNLEIWDVKLTNLTAEPADLSVFSYFEWCLGSSADHHREFHKCFIETEFDKDLNGFVAGKRIWEIPLGDRGHWNIEYPYKGFLTTTAPVTAFECDKENFLGNFGDLLSPEAVRTSKMTGTAGIWYDPVASLQSDIQITPGETYRYQYFAGIQEKREDIASVTARFNSGSKVDEALAGVKAYWAGLLGTLEIETPDAEMNLFINKWVRYQAIAGRLWARTAYYQQSGAFGFRDQLQDSLIWLPVNPENTVKQMRLHARHQFQDGQVLHWWHPITETGLPTNMVDDLLWLPFVLIHYLWETDDRNVLDLEEPYYDNASLKEGLYSHSVKAIEKVFTRFSTRGLPLIGAGDWNDGLSAVGLEMKGESVWMAEFFYFILTRFAPVCRMKGESKRADDYEKKAADLKKAFDLHAWDGEYFYRGTKDSGEKFGSRENEEGKIFLNAQTWSVMSGIADRDKQEKALDAVKRLLIFNNGPLLLNPGYSKPDKYIGYLTRYAAGRRENGGVYMHAATWAIWAYALHRDPATAYDVFRKICPVVKGTENPDLYQAEPYVTPGNIEGPTSALYGRAGWTWYTGSAGWLAKVTVDWILGIRTTEAGLIVDPCIPAEWKSYTVKRLYRHTEVIIRISNPDGLSGGVNSMRINGKEFAGNVIPVTGKNKLTVEIVLGK